MCCTGFNICPNMFNKPEIFLQCFYNGTCQTEQKLGICSGYGTLLMDLLEVSHLCIILGGPY